MIKTLRSYQEQCLKSLIEIAQNNGYYPNPVLSVEKELLHLFSRLLFDWESNDDSFIQILLIELEFYVEIHKIDFKSYELKSNDGKKISIKTPSDLTSDIIRAYLVNKPDSERLEIFLDIFSILVP